MSRPRSPPRGRSSAGTTGAASNGLRINHQPDADYHLLQFTGPPTLIETLSHDLRITDGVVRFRVIKNLPGTPAAPESPPPVVATAAPPAVARIDRSVGALPARRRVPSSRPRAAKHCRRACQDVPRAPDATRSASATADRALQHDATPRNGVADDLKLVCPFSAESRCLPPEARLDSANKLSNVLWKGARYEHQPGRTDRKPDQGSRHAFEPQHGNVDLQAPASPSTRAARTTPAATGRTRRITSTSRCSAARPRAARST